MEYPTKHGTMHCNVLDWSNVCTRVISNYLSVLIMHVLVHILQSYVIRPLHSTILCTRTAMYCIAALAHHTMLLPADDRGGSASGTAWEEMGKITLSCHYSANTFRCVIYIHSNILRAVPVSVTVESFDYHLWSVHRRVLVRPIVSHHGVDYLRNQRFA